MGRLTVLVAALTFLVAAGAAYLSGTAWIACLAGLGVLLPLLGLCAAGWLSRWRLTAWPDRAWALVPGALALAAVGLAFVVPALRGPDPRAAPVSIDLGVWALSGARLAGLVAALGFGIYTLGADGVPVRVLGAGVAVAAFLAAQPLLAAYGLPVIGPAALGLAVAVLAAAGWLRRRWASAGPGSPDRP